LKTVITGGNLVTPDQLLPGHTLVIEGQKISAIGSREISPDPGVLVISAAGLWVCPGFIDIHAHGAMGSGTMDATPAAIHRLARFKARHGVTSYLPTTWSARPTAIMKAIENIAGCPQPKDGARHLGVHIEGPYLNKAHRGAQLPDLIRPPDPQEYEAWLETGVIRLVTLAPEIEGALDFVDRAVPDGVEFAIGHSGATFEQILEAADHGVRHVTHLFNGMAGLHHRRPGTVGGCLAEDRLLTQLIADGIHVHPALVKVAARAKTPARMILITDAIRGAGLADGDYEFGDQVMFVRDGVSRTPQGHLSGSTLTMDLGLRNLIDFTGLSLQEALPMATSVPAESIGLAGIKGALVPGADADLVFLDAALEVRKTMILGRIVYDADESTATNI
jgi:N-acetylglucosamine-6-phosphate deacetylase